MYEWFFVRLSSVTLWLNGFHITIIRNSHVSNVWVIFSVKCYVPTWCWVGTPKRSDCHHVSRFTRYRGVLPVMKVIAGPNNDSHQDFRGFRIGYDKLRCLFTVSPYCPRSKWKWRSTRYLPAMIKTNNSAQYNRSSRQDHTCSGKLSINIQ